MHSLLPPLNKKPKIGTKYLNLQYVCLKKSYGNKLFTNIIDKNENEIVSVPFGKLICRETISKTTIGQEILSQWPAISDDKFICLFLIRIRFYNANIYDGNVEHWIPFFNLLQNVEYHTAINFNEREVASLDGTQAHRKFNYNILFTRLTTASVHVVEMRNELLEECRQYNEPYDHWIWAQSTLRLFGEQAQLNPQNADETTLVLFPTVNQLRPNAAHPVQIHVDFAEQRVAVVSTVPGIVS